MEHTFKFDLTPEPTLHDLQVDSPLSEGSIESVDCTPIELDPVFESGSLPRPSRSTAEALKPKRPRNAFIIFRSEACKGFKSVERDNRHISHMASHLWNNLCEERKAIYRRMASEEKARHREMYPDYRFTPRPRSRPVIRRNVKRATQPHLERSAKIADMYKRGLREDDLKEATAKLDEECPIVEEDEVQEEKGKGSNKRRRSPVTTRRVRSQSQSASSDASETSSSVVAAPLSPLEGPLLVSSSPLLPSCPHLPPHQLPSEASSGAIRLPSSNQERSFVPNGKTLPFARPLSSAEELASQPLSDFRLHSQVTEPVVTSPGYLGYQSAPAISDDNSHAVFQVHPHSQSHSNPFFVLGYQHCVAYPQQDSSIYTENVNGRPQFSIHAPEQPTQYSMHVHPQPPYGLNTDHRDQASMLFKSVHPSPRFHAPQNMPVPMPSFATRDSSFGYESEEFSSPESGHLPFSNSPELGSPLSLPETAGHYSASPIDDMGAISVRFYNDVLGSLQQCHEHASPGHHAEEALPADASSQVVGHLENLDLGPSVEGIEWSQYLNLDQFFG
ncbi:hypothetical protein D9758_013115 [Tetrapyrgos nigripes]|uniref:HMG box domain-containing protein n=1 Tax=Tetrapyrgos nigripes TaxID=182062 RepID=A0A8H5FID6_9AGAR|nr:hypothetical protein D9758_013115 [Tetrapyrgos nigripes]